MIRQTFRLRVLVLLAALVAPALLRADAPSNVPQFCSFQTRKCTTCHGDIANECVLLSLDLGETTPWTGSMPVHLKVRTSEASPSLSTPSQLKLVLGYTFLHLGPETSGDEGGNAATFSDEAGRSLEFRFESGSSVGVPRFVMGGDAQARLQMVDAEGWATLSDPAFFDLYPGDGSVWRYVASPAAADFGALARYVNPRGAAYTWDDMGVAVLRDASGFLRQVATRTRLADIVVHSATHYTVTVYPLTEDPQTDPDTGLLVPPPHDPVRVLDVRRGTTDRELIVGYQKGTGDMRTYRYVAKNGNWELTNPSGLIDANELYFADDETGARRIHVWKDSDGTALRRMEANFVDKPWGWAMTNFVEGIPGDATRTTSWSYFESGPHQGLVQEKIIPTGNRILYEYDAQNRVVRESMPLVEEETLYSYEPVDSSDPPLLCDTRPRCVVRKMQGVEIQRTYYVYGTNGVDVVERVGEQGADYGGTNVLRTIKTYYPVTGSVIDGLVQSVRHEDGTIDNYTYDLTDGVWTETVTHVHEQAPDIVPMRTTRSVRVYNALGQLVDSRTDLCTAGVEDLVPQADWTPIERLQYAYDVDGNEIRREDLAGRLWTAEWAGNCCGKVSETDWQGITTTYAYDDEGRVVARQTGSVLTETAYDALGRATNVARRGIATADHPAATVHPSSFAYDSLDRETMREGEDGICRLYAYAYRPEGGEIRTVTEAPGTDCERVTTAVFDAAGRMVREIRNGALRRTTVFEPLRETDFEGSKGTSSPVWREAQFDLFGRIAQTRKPGFGGAVLYSRSGCDSYGRTVETEEEYTPAESGSADVATSRRLTVFDAFGDLVLSAEDVNRNGLIDLTGPDVVVSNVNSYAVSDGSVWSVSESFAFPDVGSDGSVVAGERKTRLTGLGSIVDGTSIGSAELVSEAVEKNILGNATTARMFSNRTSGRILQSSRIPTSVVAAETIRESGAAISIRSVENVTTRICNDALLRPVAAVDMFGNETVTAYDEFGRVAWREDPSGARTLYAYDGLGRQVSVTDALGNEKTTAFDSDDNAVSLRGAQYPVDYTYDEYGRMATMTTYRTEDLANGDVTTWIRDEATGLVTNKVYADGNGPTYAYTPDGKPTRTTWARGAWFENVYDGQGRIVQVLHDDAALDAEMEYDRVGRLVSSSVPAASYRYTLDLLGNATNEVAVIAGVTNTILRGYDALGRQTRLSIADSDYDQSFAYDDLGRLSIIGIPGSTVTYAYTPDSLDVGYSVLTPSNAVLTRALSRDPLRRGLTTSISNFVNGTDSSSSFHYTHDALGRPIARNLDEFGYNARGEIAWVRNSTNALAATYNYDLIGNITSNCLHGAWSQFTANAINEYESIQIDSSLKPFSCSNTKLAYDRDGNLITNGVWSYFYDSMNRLSEVCSNGVSITKNVYDALWRRVASNNGNTIHRHLYDDWNRILEIDGPLTNSNDSYWGKDISGELQGAGGIGGLLAIRRPDGMFFPVYDNVGNAIAYHDSNGSIVASYEYDIFGGLSSCSGISADTFDCLFSTKCFDRETQLHYYGYRFYNAQLSRWLNRDPIGSLAGPNELIFLNNDPVQYVDKLGLRDYKAPTPAFTNMCEGICGADITTWFAAEIAAQKAGWDRYKSKMKKKPSANDYAWFAYSNQYYKPWPTALFVPKPKMKKPFEFNKDVTAPSGKACGSKNCGISVTLCGKCIPSSVLGNLMFGMIAQYAGFSLDAVTDEVESYKRKAGEIDPYDAPIYKVGYDAFSSITDEEDFAPGGVFCTKLLSSANKQNVSLEWLGVKENTSWGVSSREKCMPCGSPTKETQHGGSYEIVTPFWGL